MAAVTEQRDALVFVLIKLNFHSTVPGSATHYIFARVVGTRPQYPVVIFVVDSIE